MTHKLATGCMHTPSTPMHQQTIDDWNATTAMQWQLNLTLTSHMPRHFSVAHSLADALHTHKYGCL
jgi:uncharacterized protein involved in propanediol utilization